jgi:hypothetical protein
MPGPNQPTQPGTPSPYGPPNPLHFELFQNPLPSQSDRWQQFLAWHQQRLAEQTQSLHMAQPWSGAFNPQPNPLLTPDVPLLRRGNPHAGDPQSLLNLGSTLGEAEPMDQMGLLQAMMGRG